MIERRRHQRSRTFHSGTVAFRGQDASDCVVRNLSEGGAMLLLGPAQRVGAEVELDATRGGGRRPARVVWRAEASVGIAFAPAVQPRPTAGGTVVSLDAARRERRPASDEDRLAERIARITQPRTGAKPFWLSPGANV